MGGVVMGDAQLLSVQNLLNEVGHLRKYHERLRADYALDFNFFTELHRDTEETAHTRFIASLLSPKSRHGQDKRFLELFLQELGLHSVSNGQLIGTWTVTPERVLRDHGRVDILVEGPDMVIAIENKINHHETEGQLSGYCNWLEKHSKSKKKHLVFLTRYGSKPEPELNSRNVEILCCAYGRSSSVENSGQDEVDLSATLSQWLEQCMLSVTLVPRLRETIAQYLELVKRIGGEPVDNNEREGIAARIIADAQSFLSAQHIANSLQDAKVQISSQFWNALFERLKGAGGSRGWGVNAVAIDQDSIKKFYRDTRNRKSNDGEPRIDCDLNIPWNGYRLFIRLERHTYDPKSSSLKLKLKVTDTDTSKSCNLTHIQGVSEFRDAFPKTVESDVVDLQTTEWSIFYTKHVWNGRLDVVNFNGNASAVVEKESRDEIVDHITELVGKIADASATVVKHTINP